MLAVLAIDYLGRQLIFFVHPVVRVGNPVGPMVNFALFVLVVIGLALSRRANGIGIAPPHADAK